MQKNAANRMPTPSPQPNCSTTLLLGKSQLDFSTRPLLMGILNVTTDSFSDGGKFIHPKDACLHAEKLFQDGADIVDIGAESTRPGAIAIDPKEEWARLKPVVEILTKMGAVSIDTRHAEVAARALETGAHLINDISGGEDDPNMFHVVAQAKVPYILMHKKGEPTYMQLHYTPYCEVVSEVNSYLHRRVLEAEQAGIRHIFIDPGIGFGKSLEDNWQLTLALSTFKNIAQGIVYGCSRKKMIQAILPTPYEPNQLDEASAQVGLLATARGANILRVHDPKPYLDRFRNFCIPQNIK